MITIYKYRSKTPLTKSLIIFMKATASSFSLPVQLFKISFNGKQFHFIGSKRLRRLKLYFFLTYREAVNTKLQHDKL